MSDDPVRRKQSDLVLKQQRFMYCVGKLILFVYTKPGYALTAGELYRTPYQAAENARLGIGVANSVHTDRLAIDLQLWIDGILCTDSKQYKFMGDYWKSLDIRAYWGGDFSKPDGNHFSFTHDGRR